MSETAPAPRPPWRELFSEAALRRLARLALLRGGEELVWLGERGEKFAKQLEKICEARVKLRTELDGIAKRSVGLLVAPEIVGQGGLDKALKQLRGLLETDGVLALAMAVDAGGPVSDEERGHGEQRQAGPLQSLMEAMGELAASGFEPLTAELLPRKTGVGEPAVSGASLCLLVGRRVEPGAPPRWPRRAGME